MPKNELVIKYARMWPRAIFDLFDDPEDGKRKKQLAIHRIKDLQRSGIYVLYIDDAPYYIGKATVLFNRLHDHANKFTDRYFNLWNYFSAFVVDKTHMSEVERILIAAMPTANSAAPKIEQINLPLDMRKILRKARTGKYGQA
jgi:predicted GIY-YIG superfamily endonuclease